MWRKIKQKCCQPAEPLPKEKTTDPYLAARLEWNFLCHDLIKAKHHWKLMAFGLSVLTLFASIGMFSLAKRPQYIPYVVEVDRLGHSQFESLLQRQHNLSVLEYKSWISTFVINVRSIVADPQAKKRELDHLYTMMKPAVEKQMNAHYQAEDPFELAKKKTREVIVHTVLAKSAKTWQVRWSEVERDLQGRQLSRQEYEGIIALSRQRVEDLTVLQFNPQQLFVEQFTWTVQQG